MKKMVSILICALALMVGHIQAQEVELTKEEKKALQEKIDRSSMQKQWKLSMQRNLPLKQTRWCSSIADDLRHIEYQLCVCRRRRCSGAGGFQYSGGSVLTDWEV